MGGDPNNRGLSRKHIFDAIDHSLHRLGVDHVDLYQIHRFDPDTPIEETLEALNDVVRAGKARYIGASSMYAWQFMKMLAVSRANNWTPFVSMQPQYNLVYREEEREMLPLCRDQGIGVIPWSPLARGFLAGGRARPGEGETERARTDEFAPRLYYREPDHAVVDALETIASARGVPNMQVALAWVLRNPVITAPIIGTSKSHHLTDAVAALSLQLTDDEVKALEAPYRPKPVLDHL
jgi:aryl-alcohol dehydrogenase (NADP+)